MATKITSRVIAPGAVTAEALAPGVGAGPVIANVQIANSSYVALDDTAVALDGGYILINGENFGQNVQVIIANTNATSVTYISSSLVRAQVPAKSAGSYIMYLVNTDTGATAIRVNAVTYSGVPTWVTGSSLTEGAVDEAISIQLSASNATSYQVQTGSTLPSGLTLAANGLLSGTVTGLAEDTLYNFTIEAIDDENQDSPRAFSITITAGDQDINSVVLALKADSNTFITDTSTNSFTITPNGDTRPSAFSPYNTSWSNYFDGTGDYLSLGTPVIPASSNFTLECWFYIGSYSTQQEIFYQNSASTSVDGRVLIYVQTTGILTTFIGGTNRPGAINSTTLVQLNAWNHFALVRNGNNYTLYLNGVSEGTGTGTGTICTENALIGTNILQLRYITGYISNFRVVNSVIYSSNFTPPTSPLTAISGTSLLTCQSNRLIDNSTNNFTITKNGDVKVTAFGPFTETDTTTGSGYFDGTGDYLTASHSNMSGTWTVECWWYAQTVSTQQTIVSFNSGSNSGINIWCNTSGQLVVDDGVNSQSAFTTTTFRAGQWNHLAVVRNGSTTTGYINGIAAGSNSFTPATVNAISIGRYNSSPFYYVSGYVSGLRTVVGTAVYTSNFTPPTSPLTAISGTSLLTLQSRISYNNSQPIDESGISNIITRNGNASVGSYSPLSPAGWSAYFDGTGDYLTTPSNVAFAFGTGNFTIEAWVYSLTQVNTYNGIFGTYNATDGVFFEIVNNRWYVYLNNNHVDTGVSVSFNTWNHVAVVRNLTTLTVYLNGTSIYSANNTQNFSTTTSAKIAEIDGSGSYEFTGYISNARIVKGTAVYTSNFTPPTAPLEPIANTSLLTLRSNSFVDEGPNRFAITRNGDTRITTFSPFKTHTIVSDSHSVYFDGTGDYFTLSATPTDLLPGTSDATFECWVQTISSTEMSIFSNFNSSSPFNGVEFGVANGYQTFWSQGTWFNRAGNIIGSAGINDGAWHHLAWVITNSGTTITTYIDGVQNYTSSITPSTTGNSTQSIGSDSNSTRGRYFNGYIANLRFVKGTVVYTSAFTPSTQPLTAIANTSLLTCQSPTVIDNSNNAFAITVNGNSQPTKYNPFGETITTGVEYSLTNHGGSYYFDGTGDYLNTPATAQFAPVGQFTIECYVYINSLAAIRAIIGNYTTNATTDWVIDVTTAGVLRAFTNGSTARISSASGAIQVGEWEHIVLTRNSSNVISLFLNGVLIGTYSQSGVFGSASKAIYIGVQNVSTNPMLGYISNLRMVEGTALYTSAFVPPTAPPTPVKGTTLLLNGAGAAITDGVGKNVLETVGNARVINGVKKYGTGAMYFDGTGDYLIIPNSDAYAFGNGNWTIELWIYLNALGRQGFVTLGNSSGTNVPWEIGLNSSNKFRLLIQTAGGQIVIDGATTPSTSTWYHIAAVRNGVTSTLYLNGISDASSSSLGTNPIVSETNFINVGTHAYGFPLNGYIDDLRITKGVARYTSNFTPPTSFKLK